MGSCRICLIEVNNNLGVACSLPLLNNMVIFTDNTRIRKSREGIIEFLLLNHPLDCPICDQGGECDLQDILYFLDQIEVAFMKNLNVLFWIIYMWTFYKNSND